MADNSKSGLDIARRERASGPLGDFDRLFDALTQGFYVAPFGRNSGASGLGSLAGMPTPKADVSETGKAFTMTVELPGIAEKDVEISVSDSVLTIRGRKEAARKEEKANYHLTEREYGSFERAIRLPPSVDLEKIAASFDKGVLTVEMPKAVEEQSRTKRIPIGNR